MPGTRTRSAFRSIRRMVRRFRDRPEAIEVITANDGCGGYHVALRGPMAEYLPLEQSCRGKELACWVAAGRFLLKHAIATVEVPKPNPPLTPLGYVDTIDAEIEAKYSW